MASMETERQPWSSGLYACFDDCPSCLVGTCCPCVLFGFNHKKVTGSGCILPCFLFFILLSLCGFVCCVAGPVRGQLRRKYGLEESPCSDVVVHSCCCLCGVCQEAREIDYRAASVPQPGAYTAPSTQTM